MVRNTHDRSADHFGTDLDTDSVLSSSLPAPVSTASGQTVRQGLLDIIANLGGGGGGGGGDGLTDLLTGDDMEFSTTIGSWAAHGTSSTATFDGAVGIKGNGSAKFHSTTGSPTRYIDVPVAGTFKAGQLYHARLLIRAATLTTTDYVVYEVKLGDEGAADLSVNLDVRFAGPDNRNLGGLPSNEAIGVIVPWIPSADRTSVTIRIPRGTDMNLTTDLWIEEARVVAVPGDSPGLSGPFLAGGTVFGGGAFTVFPVGLVTGLGIRDRSNSYIGLIVDQDSARLAGPLDSDLNNATVTTRKQVGLQLYGNQQFGVSRRFEAGFNLEVGPDYVGLYVSERSSTEVEIQPDGNYDLIFIDGEHDGDTTHHTRFEVADGSAVAIPSMGMLPQYSSAPHSGTETEGESYFDTTLHKNRTWASGAWHDWW